MPTVVSNMGTGEMLSDTQSPIDGIPENDVRFFRQYAKKSEAQEEQNRSIADSESEKGVRKSPQKRA